jgi:hypothetical protein
MDSYINNIQKKFESEGLIFYSKANIFYNNVKFTEIELKTYKDYISSKKINNPNYHNLLALVLFHLCKIDNKYINEFNNKININLVSNPLTKEQLYLVYNIIEFEDTYHQRKKAEIKDLYDKLKLFAPMNKVLHEYLLYKYYSGICNLYVGNIEQGKTYSNEIISDIIDEVDNNMLNEYKFKYIQLKNTILNWRFSKLECEEIFNTNELLASTANLYSQFKEENNKLLAIKTGIILFNLHNDNFEINKCIEILNEIYSMLKNLSLNGELEIDDSIELFLTILSKLENCYIYNSDIEKSKKILKKINKNLLIILNKNYIDDNKGFMKKKENFEELKYKYLFFLLCSREIDFEFNAKYLSNSEELNKASSALYQINEKDIIKKYKEIYGKFMEKKNTNSELDNYIKGNLINIFSLNNNDTTSVIFKSNLNDYRNNFVRNLQMEPNVLLFSLFGIYNNISSLTKLYNSEKENKEKLLNSIKEKSNMLVQYSISHFFDNELNAIFNLNYIKDLIIKTYYALLNTYYLAKKDKNLEEEFKKYENFIESYGVKNNINNALIYKLKGNYYYMKKNYDLAVKNYNEGLELISKKQNKFKLKADILFNLGICNILLNKTSTGKKNLKQCSEIFELNLFNDPGSEDGKKKKLIDDIMNKLGD